MRDILFRGKSLESEDWREGQYVLINDDHRIVFKRPYEPNKYLIDDVDPATVGQYTWTTDKNGAKIFKGDIVSAKNKDGGEIYRFEVKFGKCGGTENVEHDVGYMGFYFEEITGTIPGEFMLRKDPLYWLNAYECEIIGNVYDNPELMIGR